MRLHGIGLLRMQRQLWQTGKDADNCVVASRCAPVLRPCTPSLPPVTLAVLRLQEETLHGEGPLLIPLLPYGLSNQVRWRPLPRPLHRVLTLLSSPIPATSLPDCLAFKM